MQERAAPLPLPLLETHRLPGQEILAEATGPGRVPLWQAYRAVHAWASTPRGERNDLLDPEAERQWTAEVLAAHLPPAAERSLRVIAGVWGDPIAVDPGHVSVAMRTLSAWAGGEGWPQSAALLAEAGATAAPGDASAAYAAGRAFVHAGLEDSALRWFQYALFRARQQASLTEIALLLDSIGEYNYRRGNLRRAERLHLQALGVARRARSRIRAAAALHNLCLTAGERGDLARANVRARRSARLYGKDHPSLPLLVHDLAYVWMVNGAFQSAYPLLAALLPSLTRPQKRLRTLGNMARAAAGFGDRNAFEQAWGEVVEMHRHHAEDDAWSEALADALNEAAQGALSLGEPNRAIWAADLAEPLARRSRRAKELVQLDAVRDAARARLTMDAPPSSAPVSPAPVFEEDVASYAALLAARS